MTNNFVDKERVLAIDILIQTNFFYFARIPESWVSPLPTWSSICSLFAISELLIPFADGHSARVYLLKLKWEESWILLYGYASSVSYVRVIRVPLSLRVFGASKRILRSPISNFFFASISKLSTFHQLLSHQSITHISFVLVINIHIQSVHSNFFLPWK